MIDFRTEHISSAPAPATEDRPGPSSGALSVRVRYLGGGGVALHLRGDLDMATGPTLGPLGELLARLEVRSVALDLSSVQFVDLKGWRSLQDFRQDLVDAGLDVSTSAQSAQLLRLQMLLDAIFPATLPTDDDSRPEDRPTAVLAPEPLPV